VYVVRGAAMLTALVVKDNGMVKVKLVTATIGRFYIMVVCLFSSWGQSQI
jgi:hypothetical protein